jgi:hypothetical protein
MVSAEVVEKKIIIVNGVAKMYKRDANNNKWVELEIVE